MPFKKGEKPPNPKPFLPGESGNPDGRPKGSLSRSTLAKKVLELDVRLPEEAYEKLKSVIPNLEKKMSFEEATYVMSMANALTKGDTAAFKLVLDSAYGNKQEIDHTTKGESINPTPIKFSKGNG